MCRTYRQRPSQVLGIPDAGVALDFDLAMAAVHRMERQSRIVSSAEQAQSVEHGVLTALIET